MLECAARESRAKEGKKQPSVVDRLAEQETHH